MSAYGALVSGKRIATHFHARQLLSTPLRLDQVHPQLYRRLRALLGALLGRQHHHILQALDINLVRGALPTEEVRKHALCDRELILHGALPRGTGKDDHWPQANGGFLALELPQGAEALGLDAQLDHVQHLEAEGARKGQAVRALLGAAAKDEEGGVVLFGKELERRGVLEGVDGILLGELLGERLAQGEEVGEGILGDLRAGGAAEEEDGLWVLDGLWGALLEGALGAGVAGFSG